MPSPRLAGWPDAVLVLAVLAAIVSAGGTADWNAPVHYVAKPLATGLVLLIAARATPPVSARYRRLVSIGLVCSLIGDVLLMLPADRFAAGLAAFLVAHLCYLGAFLGESRLGARPIALIGYALVAVSLFASIQAGLPTALRWPVIVYVVVITLMAAQAATWMLSTPSDNARRAAIGAAWFLVSDATLAIARFRTEVPARDFVVLGTYYLAQWCIARSVSGAGASRSTSDGIRS